MKTESRRRLNANLPYNYSDVDHGSHYQGNWKRRYFSALGI